MLKYLDTKVTFAEVPDEVTLCINITGCKNNCKGCHSSYLAEDIGEELTIERLTELATTNEGITAICFMGGDSDSKRINRLAKWVQDELDLKVAWYSGRQELSPDIDLKNFSYIKLGPYIEELGPLTSKTTNQRFYWVADVSSDNPQESKRYLMDMTDKFWKHEN